MIYAVTLLFSFVIIGCVVAILCHVRTPRYRLRRENVVTLLHMVLDGTASEHDWNVFVAIPIRYDEELENVRRRCTVIEQAELLGNAASGHQRVLFTRRGLSKIEHVLRELEMAPPRNDH